MLSKQVPRTPRRKSKPAKKLGRSRAYKHERDHAKVMAAVQRELIRYGHFTGPERHGWHWTDALPAPMPDGSPGKRHFNGRDAIVLEGGMLVDQTYHWIAGLLGQLSQQVQRGIHAPGQLTVWLAPRRERVLRLLRNTQLLSEHDIAVNAGNVTDQFANVRALLDAYRLGPSASAARHLCLALDNVRPRALAAGFYEPRGAGPIRQFEMFLKERGLSYEEIAHLLGTLTFRHDFAHEHGWIRHRACATDSLKHRIGQGKSKLIQALGDASILGNMALDLPPGPRFGMLFSVRVEPYSTASIHL